MPTKITPCLWFDTQAEEAANFYTTVFKDSKITAITRYPDTGQEVHGMPAGTVLTVSFELNGLSFTALNGGPVFKLSEAISLQVECEDQAEIDYYWEKLSAHPDSEQCGWVKDKFGLSWQVFPKLLPRLLADSDPAVVQRVMQAVLQMKKIDLAEIQRAAQG